MRMFSTKKREIAPDVASPALSSLQVLRGEVNEVQQQFIRVKHESTNKIEEQRRRFRAQTNMLLERNLELSTQLSETRQQLVDALKHFRRFVEEQPPDVRTTLNELVAERDTFATLNVRQACQISVLHLRTTDEAALISEIEAKLQSAATEQITLVLENSELKSQNSHGVQLIAEAETFRCKAESALHDLSAENAELRGQISVLETQHKDLVKEVATLKQDNNDIVDKQRAASVITKGLRERIAVLKTTLAASRQNYSTLRTQHIKVRCEQAAAVAQTQELKSVLQALQQEHQKSLSQVSTLRGALSTAQTQLDLRQSLGLEERANRLEGVSLEELQKRTDAAEELLLANKLEMEQLLKERDELRLRLETRESVALDAAISAQEAKVKAGEAKRSRRKANEKQKMAKLLGVPWATEASEPSTGSGSVPSVDSRGDATLEAEVTTLLRDSIVRMQAQPSGLDSLRSMKRLRGSQGAPDPKVSYEEWKKRTLEKRNSRNRSD